MRGIVEHLEPAKPTEPAEPLGPNRKEGDVFEGRANPTSAIAVPVPTHPISHVLFEQLRLSSNSEQLGVLLKILKNVPNLFKDAANYDINLFNLLDNQCTLQSTLVKLPGYTDAMAKRKPVSITITPPKKGITVQAETLKPEAVANWKQGLTDTLAGEQEKAAATKLDPIEHLNQQIQNLLQAKSSEKPDFKQLLNPSIWGSKEDTAAFRTEMKKIQDKPIREKLLKLQELFPGHSNLSAVKEALEALDQEEKLARLAELYVVLSRKSEPPISSWDDAQKKIDALISEDLIFFDDKEDGLKKISEKLFKEQEAHMTDLVHQRIHAFASQEESSAQKITQTITLRELPPIVGIFRGCIGGDCSSQYSFPYPNDPHERVFFIEDKAGLAKGYVSTTEVVSGNKTYLYVISVSGARVNAGDTELIFRGLYQERAKLGVEGILLPESSKIASLINYPEPRGRYTEYTNNRKTQEVLYQDKQFRKAIEDFKPESGYNQSKYDHMIENSQGCGLVFKDEALKGLSTEVAPIHWPSFQPDSIELNQAEAILDFAVNMHASGRKKMEEQLLEIPEVEKIMTQDFLKTLWNSVEKVNSEESLKQFEDRVIKVLESILKDKTKASSFLKAHPDLLFPAALQCKDFFTDNLENAAEQTLKYLKNKNLPREFLEIEGLQKLSETKAFSKWVRKQIAVLETGEITEETGEMISRVCSTIHFQNKEFNEAIIKQAVDQNQTSEKRRFLLGILGKMKPTNLETLQKIATCLEDSDPYVRNSAAYALSQIKPTNSDILAQIAGYLTNPNREIHDSAVRALGQIKPTDLKTLQQIAGYLTNPDWEVCQSAARALGKIKPTDPKILQQIAGYLKDSDPNVRSSTARALGEIKPEALKIHQQIAELLTDSDPDVRRSAAYALGQIKPEALKIHQQIAELLTDSDLGVRSSAASALGKIKPTDLETLQQIAGYLTNPDEEVRNSAAYALDEIRSVPRG